MNSCEDELKKVNDELRLANARIEDLNRTLSRDPDTGLPLRHSLYQRMNRHIMEYPDDPFCFGIIRLDKYYQRIRNTRDRMKVLLFITGQRIEEILGEGNVYQSDRSDEFLIFIPGRENKREMTKILKQVAESIAEPHNPPAADLSFGCSIGAARFPRDSRKIEEIIENAEIAMGLYKAHKTGSFIYTPKEGDKIHRLGALDTAMVQAVKNGLEGFHIAYQPLVNPQKKLIGCEVLMRWDAPGFGNVSPGEFIPIAEDNGLIVTLGLWILYNSLRQLKAWKKTYKTDITISVNVSSVQLQSGNYLESVQNLLEAAKMPGSCLHLEVTESTLMEEPDLIVSRLTALKKMGIKIMLDDFGTGYSSLSYLHQLPIDTLKIPREFVQDLPQNKRNLDIVRAVKSISGSFGFSTLAEGVETQAQFDVLIDQGCDVIQGYLFSKPLPADEFAKKFFN